MQRLAPWNQIDTLLLWQVDLRFLKLVSETFELECCLHLIQSCIMSCLFPQLCSAGHEYSYLIEVYAQGCGRSNEHPCGSHTHTNVSGGVSYQRAFANSAVEGHYSRLDAANLHHAVPYQHESTPLESGPWKS